MEPHKVALSALSCLIYVMVNGMFDEMGDGFGRSLFADDEHDFWQDKEQTLFSARKL